MKAICFATVIVVLACCASPAQVLLAKPQPNSGAFAGGAFDPTAFHPPYQPAYTPVNPADLEQRIFPVGLAAFYAAIREKTGETDPVLGFKELAATAGVDFYPPKTVFLDGMGVLFVSATKKDVDKIQGIIDGLHCPPQKVHIKARFIEVPGYFFDKAQNPLPSVTTNGCVLTAAQAKEFLRHVLPLVEELAEPECTIFSGNESRMYATPIQPIAQNFAPQNPTLDPEVVRVETAGGYFYASHDSNHPQAGQIETGPSEIGPMLNVVPLTPPDGYTINLCVTACDAQSFDYARTAGLKSITAASVPRNQASTQKAMYDGQTLVLFPAPQQEASSRKDSGKVLVALVTATMVDDAGNRIHTDADLPFAQNKVPPPWP